MDDCLFCQIVNGTLPAFKVWEDENYIAFLGIFPRFPGMTVIATKKHTDDSYLYRSLTDEELAKLHLATKKLALIIDKALGSKRCIQVMEGFETPHAHLKLFPVFEGENYGVVFEGEKQATPQELAPVADKIRNIVSATIKGGGN